MMRYCSAASLLVLLLFLGAIAAFSPSLPLPCRCSGGRNGADTAWHATNDKDGTSGRSGSRTGGRSSESSAFSFGSTSPPRPSNRGQTNKHPSSRASSSSSTPNILGSHAVAALREQGFPLGLTQSLAHAKATFHSGFGYWTTRGTTKAHRRGWVTLTLPFF